MHPEDFIFRMYSASPKKFPLADFEQKWIDNRLHMSGVTSSIRVNLFGGTLSDLNQFFTYILVILDRLKDGINIWLKSSRLSSINLTFINLDFITLLMFCRIFMDKIARFMCQKDIMHGTKIPKHRSFREFKKTLMKYDDNKLEKLQNIINKTNWFEELKELRDDYIVHHGWAINQIMLKGFVLTSHRKEEKKISFKYIDELYENIYNFLVDLNNYLCVNIDLLPIEII